MTTLKSLDDKEKKQEHVVKAINSLRKIKLSTTELETIYQQFLRRAEDDHFLNEHEFANSLGYVGIKDPLLLKKYFSAFDINGDGSVDFKEFASGLSTITRGTTEEKIDCMWKIIDFVCFFSFNHQQKQFFSEFGTQIMTTQLPRRSS